MAKNLHEAAKYAVKNDSDVFPGIKFKSKSTSKDSVLNFVFVKVNNAEVIEDFAVIHVSRVLTTSPQDYSDEYEEVRKVRINGATYSYIEKHDIIRLGTLVNVINAVQEILNQNLKEVEDGQ